MFWEKWFKKKEPNPPMELKLLRDYKDFDPRFIENLFSSDMSIFMVTVCVPTLVEYNTLLKKLIVKLKNNTLINTQEIYLEVNIRYFQDFVLGDDRKMFSLYKELFVSWYENCVLFLTLYSELENKINKEFNEERNYFLLTPVVSNLSIILTEMKSETQRTSDTVRQ